jgi:hypothetical protein
MVRTVVSAAPEEPEALRQQAHCQLAMVARVVLAVSAVRAAAAKAVTRSASRTRERRLHRQE